MTETPKEIEQDVLPKSANATKTPLTPAELQAVWEQDEFHGKSGSYTYDEFTGKRAKRED